VPAGRSDLGTAVIRAGITAATTAATGTPSLEAVTAAVAAIYPTAGAGTPIAVATAGITAPATATAVAATGTGVATATTATTAVAAATAPIATTTGTATAAATAGFGLVDAQRTAHQLGTLQAIDGPGFAFGISHLHEGETPFTAGVALQGEGTTGHLAEGGEQLRYVFLLGTEGEVTDENAHRLTGTTDNKGK